MPLIRAKLHDQHGQNVDAAVQTDDIETVCAVTLWDIHGDPLPDHYVRVRFRKTGLEQVYLGEVSDFLPGTTA